MAFDTRELREQRHKKIVDSREILDKADKEKRGRSPEERAQYDHLWDESEDLRQKIEDHERANKLERAEDEVNAMGYHWQDSELDKLRQALG